MMIHWKQVLPALAAGILLGASVPIYAGKHFRRSFQNPEKQGHRMLERFSRKLDLTAEQKEKVGAVLESSRQRMEALWKEGRPKFDAIRESTNTEIRALLGPEQREKFDKLNARMEARRQKRGAGRGRWGP